MACPTAKGTNSRNRLKAGGRQDCLPIGIPLHQHCASSSSVIFFPSGFGFEFWTAAWGCGNVGISPLLRDFQGTVERGEKLFLLFHAFHGPAISTVLPHPSSSSWIPELTFTSD